MRKTIPLLLLSLTLPLAAETMNIQTLNGQVFEDAQIERVNPNGIDIGYVNEKGHYVLKGILFGTTWRKCAWLETEPRDTATATNGATQ